MDAGKLFRLVLFIIILLAIPVVTIVLGQLTRTQIKADVSCKQPAVPDPKDCIGGDWKLSQDMNGCIHFVCTPKK